MSIGIVVEIAVNLIQQIMLFGFLYLFFDKPNNKVKNVVAFSIAVLAIFSMENYFSFHEMTFNHIDSLITVLAMIVYTVVFLKGALYLRIIMPIVVYGLNMIVSFSTLYSLAFLGGKTLEESVAFSTSFRYIYLLLVHLIYLFLLWIMLRLRKRKLILNNIYDVLAFIIVPALCIIGMYANALIYEIVNFNSSILILVIINLTVFVFVSVMVWFLLIRISKANQAKTELLLSQQREELYKESVIDTNEQIEKISAIRHDMKNQLLALSLLMADNEIVKARRLCETLTEQLEITRTPVHSNNPVLNTILNVELDKASSYQVVFTYEINDDLYFVEDKDIISIIGNLCDNALEYLVTLPTAQREMRLVVTVREKYHCITCINTIQSSILQDNPTLSGTKDDMLFHGKGIRILKNITQKYNGDLVIKENTHQFIVSAILRNLETR